MHKQGTASKLQRALSAPRSGTRPFPILNGFCRLLAIALQRAKGRDGGKTNRRATTKSFFEIGSDFFGGSFHNFHGSHTFALPPPGFTEQRGVIACHNAPCLKLGVRKRKRTFSLGGVCDPVLYFPIGGSRSREG